MLDLKSEIFPTMFMAMVMCNVATVLLIHPRVADDIEVSKGVN